MVHAGTLNINFYLQINTETNLADAFSHIFLTGDYTKTTEDLNTAEGEKGTTIYTFLKSLEKNIMVRYCLSEDMFESDYDAEALNYLFLSSNLRFFKFLFLTAKSLLFKRP